MAEFQLGEADPLADEPAKLLKELGSVYSGLREQRRLPARPLAGTFSLTSWARGTARPSGADSEE